MAFMVRYADASTGLDLVAVLRRESDGYYYDPATQTFAAVRVLAHEIGLPEAPTGEYSASVTYPSSASITSLIIRIENKGSGYALLGVSLINVAEGVIVSDLLASAIPSTSGLTVSTLLRRVLAVGVGKWLISKTASPRTLTLYDLDGTTAVASFNLYDDDTSSGRTPA